jgi:DNA repair protein RadC
MEHSEVAEITVSYTPTIRNNPLVMRLSDAYRHLKNFFPEELIQLQEMFVVMYLNTARRILGVYRLSIGGITGVVVDVRIVLGMALKTTASQIILCHNHPSGNLRPSRQDEEITTRIKQACKLMDIHLSDHIILSANEEEYFSFADEGLI